MSGRADPQWVPPEVGVAWEPCGLLFLRKPECINSDYPREGSGASRLGGDPPPDQKWILRNLSHVYCDDCSTPCQGPLRTGDFGGNQRYPERMGCKFKCPGSKRTCADYLHSGNFLCCLSSFLTYVVKNTDYPFQNLQRTAGQLYAEEMERSRSVLGHWPCKGPPLPGSPVTELVHTPVS